MMVRQTGRQIAFQLYIVDSYSYDMKGKHWQPQLKLFTKICIVYKTACLSISNVVTVLLPHYRIDLFHFTTSFHSY